MRRCRRGVSVVFGNVAPILPERLRHEARDAGTYGLWTLRGEMIRLKRSGDLVTLVLRHTGANAGAKAISTTITRMIKGDTMVRTFSDFSSADLPFEPDWVGVPIEFRRVGKNGAGQAALG